MKKRALCLILAALMLVSVTACSETKDNSGSETKKTENASTPNAGADVSESESEEELTDYEKRQLIPDNLPEITFNGASFDALTTDEIRSINYAAEIAVEDITGDACNDAVYNRNLDVESRFEVKITSKDQATPEDQIRVMAQAGTNDYDIVSIRDYRAYVPISTEVAINWMEVPNVDTTQVWLNPVANEQATINNRLFAITSDLSTSSLTLSHAIFFNVDIMENYGYSSSDLYALVKEGKWTIDKFSEIASTIYEDKNGNGEKDKDDLFGYGYYPEVCVDVWQVAFDQPVISIEGNEIIPTIMCDKSVSIIEKLTSMKTTNPGVHQYTSGALEEETYFSNGLLAMAPLRFQAAFSVLRDMDTQYSMLPYPKWDEAQENYYTNADDKYSVFVIPLSSASELEMIGTVFTALSAESYKKVYPEYYDTALKGKYSSEAETAEMVDLIVAGRKFDFSFQFGETYLSRMCYLFRDMLLNNKTDLASEYKAKEKPLTKQIEKKLKPLYFD